MKAIFFVHASAKCCVQLEQSMVRHDYEVMALPITFYNILRFAQVD